MNFQELFCLFILLEISIKSSESLKQNEKKKLAEADKLEAINEKIQKKLESYQELYDSNQRLIYLGQKVNDIAEKYFENHKKRELMAELFKLVQIENSKRKKVSAKQKRAQKAKEQQVKQEAEKKVNVIRKKKKAEKKKAAEAPPKPKPKRAPAKRQDKFFTSQDFKEFCVSDLLHV